jgi:hypothetical protein
MAFNCPKGSDGQPSMAHMEEPWSMCVRMWSVGLHIEHRVSEDREQLFILVGASQELLHREATRMRLPMRLRVFKGIAEYDPDLVHIYVGSQTNGTMFTSANEQKLVMHLINRSLLLGLENQIALPTREKVLRQVRKHYNEGDPISAKLLKKLFTVFGASMDDHARRIGMCQRCQGTGVGQQQQQGGEGGGGACELCGGRCGATARAAQLVQVDGAFTVYPILLEEDEEGFTLNPLKLAESIAKQTAKGVKKTAEAIETLLTELVGTVQVRVR